MPGTRSIYSGGGYTIAQLVMTDRFGAPFPELMQSLVLGPAGTADSTFAQPLPPERLTAAAAGYRADGSPVPGKRHTYPEMAPAGLWTTAGDLARFAIAVQRSLRGDADTLLAKETAARMVTPFVGEFGLGFHVETRGGEPYFGHDGGNEGFQAVLLAHRDKGYGIAVMTNSDNGVALAMEIVRGVARAEGWDGYLPPPPRVVVLPPAELEAIAGRYALNGDEAVVIEARDGRLSGTAPGVGRIGLLPTSRDSLVSREAEVAFAVERGEVAQAIAILELNTELYPASANTWDSLAEIRLHGGDREGALAAYRKVLEVLAADTAASAALKQQLESNARAKLAELTP